MKIMVKIIFVKEVFDSKIQKEVIKEYVKSENFTNAADIIGSIKSIFADVLNDMFQCKLDEQLSYEKHESSDSGSEKKNYRNGSAKRRMNSAWRG